MPHITRRTNTAFVGWTRALVVGAAVLAGLRATGAEPSALPLILALTSGVLALWAADIGIAVAVIALSLPVLAVSPLVGIIMIILGIAGVRYLGADGGRAFLVVAVAAIGVAFGPAWAAVALAGFLLGVSEGALAAGIACLVIEAIGFGIGREFVGPVFSGGQNALVDFARMPASLTDPSWLSESLRRLDAKTVNGTIDALVAARYPVALVAQPLVWAAAAATAGFVAREGRRRRNLLMTLGSVAVGIMVAAGGTLATAAISGGPTASAVVAFASSSTVLALAAAFTYERFYVTETVAAPKPAEGSSAVDAEDADVDELLTLIATAEERLATDHTSVRTVMITDMKSFSRMTEEDGSILSAKAIQRHRDLLLPVVERHGGHGKSTGGDGLIAAFETPGNAVRAAVEMQQTLARYNQAHPSERELMVRIGVAEGEVVLDRRGRPFIGAAINLAARIMNLADGGQSYAAASIVDSKSVPSRALGAFELKNIAEPVEVVELIWNDAAAASVAEAG